jgi:hypothetical protein
MDRATKDDLWKELKLLQPIIDKFDDFTFRIKNWFITIFVAVSGVSIIKSEPVLLVLNIFLVVVFYFYEVAYRAAHGAFLERCRKIQKFLRKESAINEEDKTPYLDRYLFPSGENTKDSQLLSFFLKVGIEQTRAEKNVHEIKSIFEEAWKMLFQFRISLIYLFAFIANMLLAMIMKHWIIFCFSALIILVIIVIAGAIFIRSSYCTKEK